MDVKTLFKDAVKYTIEQNASDIHIISGQPLGVRIHGHIELISDYVWQKEDVFRLLETLVDTETFGMLKGHLESKGDADFPFYMDGYSFRCNVYIHRKGIALAARPIPKNPWSIDKIGLPSYVLDFLSKRQGLIILAGPTGCGKTTTLACMIDHINKNFNYHIITIEDPVEYVFEPQKSMVSQRQIGLDAPDFASALRASLRQDPDVIMVGEMRDLETMDVALNAAETGHLVLTTLHTSNAAQTIERIVNVFPAERQNQIRFILASTLLAVICQKLLPRRDGKGRVLAYEIMINTHQISSLIRNNKLNQIQNQLYMSRSEGMVPLNERLKELVKRGYITREVALSATYDPNTLKV